MYILFNYNTDLNWHDKRHISVKYVLDRHVHTALFKMDNQGGGPKMAEEFYARCPNPQTGREKASKTMQLAKREFYCWLKSGLLPHPTQWCGVRELEPMLLHKFIGWAHAVGSWFKQIDQNFRVCGTFLGVSTLFLIGKQQSVLSWLVVSRWPDNLTTQK